MRDGTEEGEGLAASSLDEVLSGQFVACFNKLDFLEVSDVALGELGWFAGIKGTFFSGLDTFLAGEKFLFFNRDFQQD